MAPAEARKWENWKAAVASNRCKLDMEANCRAGRLDAVQDFEKASPAVSSVALLENSGVAAAYQSYGRWTTENFEPLKVLGEGAFGIVHLVRLKGTKELYALKQMNKSRYHQKNRQRAYSERDALARARSQWCVELFATFQDTAYVYMVMEFVQGGDLVGLLSRKRRLSPEETRFYMAELLEAIDTVHRSGLIHRDIKPDNLVITVSGHLKLLDFGLCKRSDMCAGKDPSSSDDNVNIGNSNKAKTNNNTSDNSSNASSPVRNRMNSVCGTPQYMAPETFRGEFSPLSDLWALGVIAFECLSGNVPFHAGRKEGPEAIKIIRERIMLHGNVLPGKMARTREAGWTSSISEQFLKSLICDVERRLDVEGVRQLPFFDSIDFANLSKITPPNVPKVSSRDDTTYFEEFGTRTSKLPQADPRLQWDKELEWANYEKDGRTEVLRRAAATIPYEEAIIEESTEPYSNSGPSSFTMRFFEQCFS
mmetsp:Transcript_77130/g.160571  ORF Transcript_77130/g.160571 Transcript_77130/m.160571 type:complete len:479 (+) Transcript_77130:113-1549(+)